MSDYVAQLLAVEAKLAKDPENVTLLELKADLEEILNTLSNDEDYSQEQKIEDKKEVSTSKSSDNKNPNNIETTTTTNNNSAEVIDDNLKKKKKKKNKKKESRLNVREQFGESEKQSWQLFAKQKGLKGISKKSIFASPLSIKGKVGVGTNGIADAPSADPTINATIAASSAASSSSLTQQVAVKRKHY